MSEHRVPDLDLDVLITLALYGPVEATSWEPLPWARYDDDGLQNGTRWARPEHADDIGRMLRRANVRNLPREPGEPLESDEYTFTLLPCEVTAVEGLKTIGHYGYNTGEMLRDEAARFCDALTSALHRWLPGYDAAPWYWEARDVDARPERVATPERQASDREQVAYPFLLLLYEQGWRFGRQDVGDELPTWIDDGGFRTLPWSSYTWEASDYDRGLARVRACASDEAAREAFRAAWAVHQRVDLRDRWLPPASLVVWRFGSVVVELRRYERSAGGTDELDGFAPAADERWSPDEPPLATPEVEVLATRQAAPLGHSGSNVRIVSTTSGLAGLLALVDDATRAVLEQVDLSTHALVVLHGVSDLDGVSAARLLRLASPDGAEERSELELHGDGLRESSFAVLRIDRLPAPAPHEVVLRLPGRGTRAKHVVRERP